MIRFANEKTAYSVREMWKICFGDTDEFMDLYFSRKYKNGNTLIYFEHGVVAASLQMLPYNLRFYGSAIPTSYISGACTLPAYRGKGYMRELLIAAFKIMRQRNIPLSILIPAEEWLYGFYEKFGYEQTFGRGTKLIDLKPLSDLYPNNMTEAYSIFDAEFQQEDFLVLKTKEDFHAVIEEYVMSGCPPKYNLSGMSRIIDVSLLLGLYARKNPEKSFSIKIVDTIFDNNGIYRVKDGTVISADGGEFDFEADIRLLTRLLFGFHISGLPEWSRSLFEQHHPIMNLMLE